MRVPRASLRNASQKGGKELSTAGDSAPVNSIP